MKLNIQSIQTYSQKNKSKNTTHIVKRSGEHKQSAIRITCRLNYGTQMNLSSAA